MLRREGSDHAAALDAAAVPHMNETGFKNEVIGAAKTRFLRISKVRVQGCVLKRKVRWSSRTVCQSNGQHA
jgi:hypothetical protein